MTFSAAEADCSHRPRPLVHLKTAPRSQSPRPFGQPGWRRRLFLSMKRHLLRCLFLEPIVSKNADAAVGQTRPETQDTSEITASQLSGFDARKEKNTLTKRKMGHLSSHGHSRVADPLLPLVVGSCQCRKSVLTFSLFLLAMFIQAVLNYFSYFRSNSQLHLFLCVLFFSGKIKKHL